MVIDRALLAVPLALSVTLKVTDVVPAAVGVPLMTPVEEFKLSPAGRLPEDRDQVYGEVPPEALSV
jgi:hypothetical protein